MKFYVPFLFFLVLFCGQRFAHSQGLPDAYNVTWSEQSNNSSESMPCGGGDVGLNVWVEGNELLFYFSKSGTFDENNEFLKLGRIRVAMSPNPFVHGDFEQLLDLKEGCIFITGKNKELSARIKVWVDVFEPNIYVDINSSLKVNTRVYYENWRYEDFELRKYESFANSYKWAAPKGLMKGKDSVAFDGDRVFFCHRNKSETVFDVCVDQQGMGAVKSELFNPLDKLTFGGVLQGKNFISTDTASGKYLDTDFKAWGLKSKSPSKKHEIIISLYSEKAQDFQAWKRSLVERSERAVSDKKREERKTKEWWAGFWNRSFVVVEPDEAETNEVAWQVGRNYQLFRYMLGCNAYGKYPTKFNGGLFTYDPCFTNDKRCFTPDFRNWGGGTFTAQNQRLVYFPMLKSGDFDLMKPQFDFYKNLQHNAELRSIVYWNHKGACFTEQIENFGLPNPSEYGWKRPDGYERGRQYNAWLEYQWDTALEICFMILEQHFYSGTDISEYINLIYSCLSFFDEHYSYLARLRGRKMLDANGHLILYPGSACETYKMAYNSTSTITGLQSVIEKLLLLPKGFLPEEMKANVEKLQDKIPPITFRSLDGHTAIAPAKLWERINNSEAPQLYPVFPYGIYGVGKSGIDTASNTYKYDPDVLKFRSHVGWKQSNIFAARLGLSDDAWKYTSLKLKDSEMRFPAFWGPGFDWTPDHNWGGSGMIGLQEMLLQEANGKIYLFPAWPHNLDVHFKLHCYGNTVVEAKIENGTPEIISVSPIEREKDIVIME